VIRPALSGLKLAGDLDHRVEIRSHNEVPTRA